MSRFGETDDPDVRVWTTPALSLYPKETTRLLAMSLGQFSDEMEAGLRLALLSVGTDALPDLVQLNRIAQASLPSDDEASSPGDAIYDVSRLFERTRQVIAAVLVQSPKEILSELDLEGVDLASRRFERAQLGGVRFRKAALDGATFGKANLTKAAFRGSSLAGVVFTRANLEKVDLTGTTGHVTAIMARLNEAQIHHCDLKSSDFDGASLRDVKAEQSDFDQGSFRGAQLHRASFFAAECVVSKRKR